MVTSALRGFGKEVKLEKFDYLDALVFEDLLTEEEKMVRDAAREYSQAKLLPRVRKAYQEEKFDIDIMKEMGE
jgi:glutaryl-CoA dehydrogenase